MFTLQYLFGDKDTKKVKREDRKAKSFCTFDAPNTKSMAYNDTLTMKNRIEEVGRLPQFLDSLCEATGCDDTLSFNLNLALEEAVVNVINYAYPKDGNEYPFTLDVRAVKENEGTTLVFTLTDRGTPFDPTKAADADTTLSAQDRPIGGLGIFLVRRLMDSVSYQYVDGSNVLTMTKKV